MRVGAGSRRASVGRGLYWKTTTLDRDLVASATSCPFSNRGDLPYPVFGGDVERDVTWASRSHRPKILEGHAQREEAREALTISGDPSPYPPCEWRGPAKGELSDGIGDKSEARTVAAKHY